MQVGGGGDGEGRGRETFSCLPPYAAVPVKRLKGGEGGGGGTFPYLPPHAAAAPFKRQFARLSSIADHIIYF